MDEIVKNNLAISQVMVLQVYTPRRLQPAAWLKRTTLMLRLVAYWRYLIPLILALFYTTADTHKYNIL
jgi:hypothetical protein